MAVKKKATRFIILIILFVFVVITGLSAIVPFSGGNKNTAETDSGTVVETGTELSGTDELETSTDTEEVAAPTLTPEQAREELQKMLSGSGE